MTDTERPRQVGMLGAGAIGGAMARCLLRRGIDLLVFARRAEVLEDFARLGAATTSSLDELARSVEVLCVCLYSEEQVRAVLLGGGSPLVKMAAGGRVIVHTTVGPATMGELAALCAPRHVGVVDAPVSGTVADAEQGTITLLVGGSGEDVSACRSVMEAYGDPLVLAGGRGDGQRAKLLNNWVLRENLRVLEEAVAMSLVLGLESTAFLAALNTGSGASWVGREALVRGSVSEISAAYGPFLEKDGETMMRMIAECRTE